MLGCPSNFLNGIKSRVS